MRETARRRDGETARTSNCPTCSGATNSWETYGVCFLSPIGGPEEHGRDAEH